MRPAVLWALAIGCGSGSGTEDALETRSDARITLDPTPGNYRQTCDGSGGVAIDFDYFADVNDEDQSLRIYRRATDAGPVVELDLGPLLGLGSVEADLEDLERIGNRVFITTSHARRTNGQLDRARYRFAAIDLSGTAPSITASNVGSTDQLLDQMLVASNWVAPNANVIAALTASSELGTPTNTNLAPENMGTNIEGMASDGSGALLFGFRNPRPGGKAIVVSLANPDVAVTGAPARFGAAAELDLGGLGIRSMAYSPIHGAVLIVAASPAGGGPFKLYRWSGVLADPATAVADLTAPTQSAPEAVVPYPGTHDVQLLLDQGDVLIGGMQCKDVAPAERHFTDAIVTVN